MERHYHAPGRQLAAAQTRARIVSVARDLLLEGGPGAMTIAGLARAAGVSPQTVYNSVGGKAELIKAVYDVLLAGDEDPTPMSDRPSFDAVVQAPDVSAYAHAYARWTRDIYLRVGRLLGALLAEGTGKDPVLVDFLAQINHERRVGNRNGLRGLTQRGLVPAGERLEHIVDGVWVLTAPDVFDRLVHQCGWSDLDYATWLATQLHALVATT
jgi:AcrR family transcriptional regulator